MRAQQCSAFGGDAKTEWANRKITSYLDVTDKWQFTIRETVAVQAARRHIV